MPEPGPGPAEAAWAATLSAMERHLAEVRAGLSRGALPHPYVVEGPSVPLPASLAGRARRLLAAQGDAESLVRERMIGISRLLSPPRAKRPVPAYLDRRG